MNNDQITQWYNDWMEGKNKSKGEVVTVNVLDMLKDFAGQTPSNVSPQAAEKAVVPTDFKDITGWDTQEEKLAYELGREHEGEVLIKFIEDWNGSTNSHLGDLLSKKIVPLSPVPVKEEGKVIGTYEYDFKNQIDKYTPAPASPTEEQKDDEFVEKLMQMPDLNNREEQEPGIILSTELKGDMEMKDTFREDRQQLANKVMDGVAIQLRELEAAFKWFNEQQWVGGKGDKQKGLFVKCDYKELATTFLSGYATKSTPSLSLDDLNKMAEERYPIDMGGQDLPHSEIRNIMLSNEINWQRRIGFIQGYTAAK